MLNLECGYEIRGYICCRRLLQPLSVLGAKFGLKLKNKMGATTGAFGVSPLFHGLLDDGPLLGVGGWEGGGGVEGISGLDTACACESWPLARLMAICPRSSCIPTFAVGAPLVVPRCSASRVEA